jgi:putative transposase
MMRRRLFLHSLDGVTTVRRPVAFYVDEHNRVLPHGLFLGELSVLTAVC